MAFALRAGAARAAHRLCCQIVRLRGACQRCGSTRDIEVAHIRSRGFLGDPDGISLRTNPENCWCLCPSCHLRTQDDPAVFMDLVRTTIGEEKYGSFVRVSNAPHRPWNDADWQREAQRLQTLLRGVGAPDAGPPIAPRASWTAA